MKFMRTYQIPVVWTVTEEMEIEAESLAEAIAIAEDAPLPSDPYYLEGTFQILRGSLRMVNKDLSDEDKKECYEVI